MLELISVIDGHLQIGEDATNHEQYHTLVLTTKDGEDGVQLTKPENTTRETRFVLIAGEPLDQPVVQVRQILIPLCSSVLSTLMDLELMGSMDLSSSILRGRLWRLSETLGRGRMDSKMLLGGRVNLARSSGVRLVLMVGGVRVVSGSCVSILLEFTYYAMLYMF